MAVVRFDHINIRAENIEAIRDFLIAVLGVEVGPRPPFRSRGYWLYDPSGAIFHLTDANQHEQTHALDENDARGARGAIDHLAFQCAGYRDTLGRLQREGFAFHEADVPASGLRQVFVDGPSHITLELIFTHADVIEGGAQLVGRPATA